MFNFRIHVMNRILLKSHKLLKVAFLNLHTSIIFFLSIQILREIHISMTQLINSSKFVIAVDSSLSEQRRKSVWNIVSRKETRGNEKTNYSWKCRNYFPIYLFWKHLSYDFKHKMYLRIFDSFLSYLYVVSFFECYEP